MKVAVIVGSSSDWKIMQESCNMLDYFGVLYEKQVASVYRTSKMMIQFASEAREKGIDIVIAGAGGAAHLPGMVASLTTLPVIGVPIGTRSLKDIDSLLPIVQMSGDIPVATTVTSAADIKNTGILAVRTLGIQNSSLVEKLNRRESSLIQKVEDMQNESQ